MLNKLEFPEYLANVPEFAGAHHEVFNDLVFEARQLDYRLVDAQFLARHVESNRTGCHR